MGYECGMKKEWTILQADPGDVEKVRGFLGCSPLLAAVMVNRNIISESEIRNFRDFSLAGIRPPFAMQDMDKAVKRIAAALREREKILIFGDYDVDGVTATTLLLEFLQYAGADVSYYIPHRTKEGYDIQTDHIYAYALPAETDLIITVDCGSGRHDAVKAAKDSGIDMIITDHHSIRRPPPALAVVNPRRADCPSGYGHLAGVGVVFALLICLRKYLREQGFWTSRKEPNLKYFCDLVALGTIADMVPLLDENRVLARTGIEMIRKGGRPGIRALARISGMKDRAPDADDIAFRLAPRLNAAGRLDHARFAVELLRTRNHKRAEALALHLDYLNKKRQNTEKGITEQILADLEKKPEQMGENSLVLSHSRWHEGVLGIVAAKLVKHFCRPVILIAVRGGMGKGSGRSIPGINIYEALRACAGHLDKFGGHPMAAGLRISEKCIEKFRKDFDKTVALQRGQQDFSGTVLIDSELDFDRITEDFLDELDSLQPFGEGNPEPLFMARNVLVNSSSVFLGKHRRMMLYQSHGEEKKPDSLRSPVIEAVQFHIDPGCLPTRFDRLAYRVRRNQWNGHKKIQIIIEES